MNKDVHSVITGDLVNSTAIKGNYNKVISQIAIDIRKSYDKNMQLEMYRGDSFQGIIKDPRKALTIGVLIRAGLRRNTRGSSLEDIWDARISIGIGSIKDYKKTNKKKIGLMEGEAFVRSGKSLDKMKETGKSLTITTGNDILDSEFEAVCPFLDMVISRWTKEQAEAIYMSLLENITQIEIGKRLKKSQRAIGKRLDSGNIDKIKIYLKRYNEQIEWHYSK